MYQGCISNLLLDITTWHLSHLKFVKSKPEHVCSSSVSIKGTATSPWIWLETPISFSIFLLTPPSKFISNSFSSPHHHPNPNHHHLFLNYNGLHTVCLVSTLASPLQFLFQRVARLLILKCTSSHGTPSLKPFWELLFLLRIKFTWLTKTSMMWPIYISLWTSVLFSPFQAYPQTKVFVQYFQPLHISIPPAWNPLLLILLLITIHPNVISLRMPHSASI